MLRCLVVYKPKQWDFILPQAEFAYNDLVNKSRDKTPCQIVYGYNARLILELRDLRNIKGYKRSVDEE